MKRPLEGIKVLDISRAQMGPYAGVFLADMGADVIKVEPKTGDFARNAFLTTWYPPETIDCYCLAHNRGKRGTFRPRAWDRLAAGMSKPSGNWLGSRLTFRPMPTTT